MIRLGYMMELLAALAIGFSTAKWARASPHIDSLWSSRPMTSWLSVIITPTLQALAVVGMIGVVVEAIRKKRPAGFGVGRWTWAASGGFLVIQWLRDLVAWKLGTTLVVGSPIAANLTDWLRLRVALGTGAALSSMMWAGWLVLWIAPWPRDPAPDGREWAGRLFGVIWSAWSIGWTILSYQGM